MEPNKLEEVLAAVVKRGLELAEKTGEFIVEQAPDLIQQFYTWRLWSNILLGILAIVLLLLGRYLPYVWLDNKGSNYDTKFFGKWGDEGGIMAWILFVKCCVASVIMLGNSIYYTVYILVAPKLYIIEYFLSK